MQCWPSCSREPRTRRAGAVLRIDASSEAAFDESVATFQQKLSPARRFVLGRALRDIWSEGVQAAKAEQREYTTADYYEQIDGLSYKELVTLTDPSGDTAKDRYRAASTGAAKYGKFRLCFLALG